MSSTESTEEPEVPTTPTSLRSQASWLAIGAVCGFGVTILSLTLTLVIGLGLTVVGLVRRRADSFSFLVLGFVLGFAVYLALAALAHARAMGHSEGMETERPWR